MLIKRKLFINIIIPISSNIADIAFNKDYAYIHKKIVSLKYAFIFKSIFMHTLLYEIP
jgi:hypothetical protein